MASLHLLGQPNTFLPSSAKAFFESQSMGQQRQASPLDAASLGLGPHCRFVLPLIHYLHPRFANILSASVSETTMRPNPRRARPTAASSRSRPARAGPPSPAGADVILAPPVFFCMENLILSIGDQEDL